MGRRVKAKVGDIFQSNCYGEFIIDKVYGSESADITFLTTGFKRNAILKYIYKGKVVDGSLPLVKGRKYNPKSSNKHEAYEEWVGINKRTKFENQFLNLKSAPYLGVSLSVEFKAFSDYRVWYEEQEFAGKYDNNGKRYHIDKDILVPGSRIYSPETCVHVPSIINTFFSNLVGYGKTLKGTYVLNPDAKRASTKYGICYDPWPCVFTFNDRFSTEEEAHAYYRKCKETQGKFLAECFVGEVDSRVIEALSSFTFEKYLVPKHDNDSFGLKEKYIATLL